MKTTLQIGGMTCAKCAARVASALRAVPGVTSATVSVQKGSAEVDGTASADVLIAAVVAAGYAASRSSALDFRRRIEERRARRRNEETYWRRRTLVAILFMPLIAWSMLSMAGSAAHGSHYVEAFLYTIGLLALAPPFYRKGLPDLVKLRFDMDSMVSLGTLLAYVVSVAELFGGGTHFYFEDSVAVLAFMTVGRYLEARASSRAADAVEGLVDMVPPRTVVLRGGVEEEILTEEVRVGDAVVIRPGGKSTVDGIVEEGSASADESIMTGESLPVEKKPGDRIICGSLIHGGRVIVRAAATGEETSLAEILRELESIGEKKSGYQKFADRVIAVFMPVVLGAAATTFIGWWIVTGDFFAAIRPTVAVLVIACPCAIGIAIPVAVSVGAAAAARRGILFRDPTALDRISGLKVFVFDKTGSLTEARLTVSDTLASGISSEEAARLTASLERASEHPLARAIVAAAGASSLHEVKNFRSSAGFGAEGDAGGWSIRAGRPEWACEAFNDAERAWIDERATEGKTVFASCFKNGAAHARALFALIDVVRTEAPEVVAGLRRRGYRTLLLTGDHEATARAVGMRLGFDEIMAEVKPSEKAEAIRAMRAKFGGVAMLGDGVNDGPALAEADLGIAMASGSGVAVEAGAVSLVRADLRLIPEVIRLGRAIELNARQNLFWAFAYNVILIPLAAFGVATPMMAAVAMGLSDVTVVANALRLWRFARE